MVKKNEANQDNILEDISSNEMELELKKKMENNKIPESNQDFITSIKNYAKEQIRLEIQSGEYTKLDVFKGELHRKITCVKNDMQGILETGENQSQRFKYITYKMAEAYLSQSQHKNRINFFLKEITNYEIIPGVKSYYQATDKQGNPIGEVIDKTGEEVIVTAIFTVVDCDTGYNEDIKMIDSAYRQNGTSSIDKVITFLQKRCEFKIFNVTSSEASEDDPEGHERNLDKENNDKKFTGFPVPKKNEVAEAKKEIDNLAKTINVPKKTFFELLKEMFPNEQTAFLKALVKKSLGLDTTLTIPEADYKSSLQKCKDNAEELRDELR